MSQRRSTRRSVLARVAALALFVASCSSEVREERPPLRVAFSSAINFADAPTLMAHRSLAERGHVVTTIYYAQPEVAAAAMARGDADFLLGSTRVLWAAAVKGAPVVAVLQDALDNNVLVAPATANCAGLARGRIGLHSPGSSGTILLRAYLADECPKAVPTLIYIPGSATRTASLLAGAVDAAVIQRSDALAIEMQTGRQLAVLQDFGVRWPGMVMRATFAHTGFARAHPDMVQEYVEACLQAFRTIAGDYQRLASEAGAFLNTGEDLAAVSREYVESGIWPVDGGLDNDQVKRTVDFFSRAGVLPDDDHAPVFADRIFLDRALTRIGRHASSVRRDSR